MTSSRQESGSVTESRTVRPRRAASSTRHLTIEEVCEDLEISRSTFYEWRAKKKAPPCFRLPNGGLRIRRSAYVRSGKGVLMETTYNVHIWKTRIYNGTRATTYYVRWSVAGGGQGTQRGLQGYGAGGGIQVRPGLGRTQRRGVRRGVGTTGIDAAD